MHLLAPTDGPLARWSSFFVLPAALLCGLVGYMLVGMMGSALWLVISGGSVNDLLNMAESSGGLQAVLGGNAIGLVGGLGAASFVLARLDSSRPRAAMRFAAPHPRALILAVVGLAALQPIILWLGEINASLPIPEFIRAMEAQQLEMIQWIIEGDGNLMLNLLLVAVVPGICEELFFRGYVQQRAERSWGVAWGIAFSGVVFGLFHLRLSEALPLCALGLFMAYLVWSTGSIWVPIAIHFANNAAALLLARVSGEDVLEAAILPWPWIVAGVIVFTAAIGMLHFNRPTQNGVDRLD